MKPLSDLLDRCPLPEPEGDKDAKGTVVIVGGPPSCPGAVILAATAALRVGSGRVQLVVDPTVTDVALVVPEAAVLGWDQHSAPHASVAEWAEQADVVIVGPGHTHVDDATVKAICGRTSDAAVVLLDAGALDAATSVASERRLVIAPNPTEASKLLGRDADDADEASLADLLAKHIDGPVAVRGAVTVIADGAESWLFDDSPTGLGTPGSGDVFMGVLGGVLAGGVEPLAALAWAVALHAEAGRLLSAATPVGYLASDLARELPFARAALTAAGAVSLPAR
ncbi:MAG: ADP-dependent NAD(P)H-hydrate dehydratase [Actinomycetota bacterium]|jgi:hydroxyethylthiazole kinase-like uncharacterized protein yjeF